MKHIVVSALVAAIISGIVIALFPRGTGDGSLQQNTALPAPPPASSTAAPALRVTDALPEDVWLDGSRQAGDDHRILTNAESSVCFITKVDVRGVTSGDDAYSCSMEVDEFTGFWDLVVSVPEGSQASVRCNARCLTWE